ncbi:putative UDP-glucose:Glycoprotein Glucosyltransferase [Blattamonas nauphoetae]|uniref:UDP-glucose:Glycoprotein Glucosyltransferase n=1 Tax=Blattamonas nauphoetae TaxID=2049346 RepID=A0ABQ9XVS7_9EUKA|nr:putative UDP-glucose:Glycoprotein Glucosyltransferase [Blattamonas nauphoetae]
MSLAHPELIGDESNSSALKLYMNLASKTLTDARKQPLSFVTNTAGHLVSYIINKSSTPLNALTATISDFPIHLPQLLKTRTSKTIKEDISYNIDMFTSDHSLLLCNGRKIDPDSPLPSIISVLRQESIQIKRLLSYGLPSEAAISISSAGLMPALVSSRPFPQVFGGTYAYSMDTIRIACRVPSLSFYLNNIETQKEFKDWPKDPRKALMAQKGGIPHLRRNALVLSVWVDITSREGVSAILQINELLAQKAFVRFAVVPVIHPTGQKTSEESKSQSTSPSDEEQVQNWYIWHCLARTSTEACQIIESIARQGESVSPATVKKTLQKAGLFPAQEWNDIILGKNQTVDNEKQSIVKTIQHTNIPLPCALFNGILGPCDDIVNLVQTYIEQEFDLYRLLLSNGFMELRSKSPTYLAPIIRSNEMVETLWNATRTTKIIEHMRQYGVVTQTHIVSQTEAKMEEELRATGAFDEEGPREKIERGLRTGVMIQRKKLGGVSWGILGRQLRGFERYSFITSEVFSPQTIVSAVPVNPHAAQRYTRNTSWNEVTPPHRHPQRGIVVSGEGQNRQAFFLSEEDHLTFLTVLNFFSKPSKKTPTGVDVLGEKERMLKNETETVEEKELDPNSINSTLLKDTIPLTHILSIDIQNPVHRQTAINIIDGMKAGTSQIAFLWQKETFKTRLIDRCVGKLDKNLQLWFISDVLKGPDLNLKNVESFMMDWIETHIWEYRRSRSPKDTEEANDREVSFLKANAEFTTNESNNQTWDSVSRLNQILTNTGLLDDSSILLITNGFVRSLKSTRTSFEQLGFHSARTIRQIADTRSLNDLKTSTLVSSIDNTTSAISPAEFEALEASELIQRATPLFDTLVHTSESIIDFSSFKDLIFDPSTPRMDGHESILPSLFIAHLSLIQSIHSFSHPRATPVTRELLNVVEHNNASFTVPAPSGKPTLSILSSFNPLDVSQRKIPFILSVINTLHFNAEMNVFLTPYLHCPSELEKILSFYRFPTPFSDDQASSFTNLPMFISKEKKDGQKEFRTVEYKLSLDPPKGWSISELSASCDRQKIVLSNEKPTQAFSFHLDSLTAVLHIADTANLPASFTPIKYRSTSSRFTQTSLNTQWIERLTDNNGIATVGASIGSPTTIVFDDLGDKVHVWLWKERMNQDKDQFSNIWSKDASIGNIQQASGSNQITLTLSHHTWDQSSVNVFLSMHSTLFRKSLFSYQFDKRKERMKLQQGSSLSKAMRAMRISTTGKLDRNEKDVGDEELLKNDVANILVAPIGKHEEYRTKLFILSAQKQSPVRVFVYNHLLSSTFHNFLQTSQIDHRVVDCHEYQHIACPFRDSIIAHQAAGLMIYTDVVLPTSLHEIIVPNGAFYTKTDLNKLKTEMRETRKTAGGDLSIGAVRSCVERPEMHRYQDFMTDENSVFLSPTLLFFNLTDLRLEETQKELRTLFSQLSISFIDSSSTSTPICFNIINSLADKVSIAILRREWSWSRVWCKDDGRKGALIWSDEVCPDKQRSKLDVIGWLKDKDQQFKSFMETIETEQLKPQQTQSGQQKDPQSEDPPLASKEREEL